MREGSPKTGSLWLTDGAWARLRPERSDHAPSSDFVEDRPHAGRKFRMIDVIEAFTRECPAIRIDRKPTSTDVIDVPSDLLVPRGRTAPIEWSDMIVGA